MSNKEYIERKAMLQKIDSAFKEYVRNGDILKLFSECRASIIYSPASDVVEVRHGEWVQTTEPLGWSDLYCIECSACGESWVMGEELCVDDYKDDWNYCPNCGAKMDGKGEGE